MQIETLAELLAFDKENDWLSRQPDRDLKRLVGIFIDLDMAVDIDEHQSLKEDFYDLERQRQRDEEREGENRDALEEVRELLLAGRMDDAMLLIERTLYPRRPVPMRSEAA
jgi:hypothetical protein